MNRAFSVLALLSVLFVASVSASCGQCSSWNICCSKSDKDGDGWGWENGASCVVKGSTAQRQHCPNGAVDTEPSTPQNGCPANLDCPAGYRCGCYAVPGLGARKSRLVQHGADLRFLASAMMETEHLKTDYTYGDGKSFDSFNAGLAKQNWFLARRCYGPWKNLKPKDFETMAVLNSNTNLDVAVYSACRAKYSLRQFFGAHRNGETGFRNPNTDDIKRFIASYLWTMRQLKDHMKDDLRFWVEIPAI